MCFQNGKFIFLALFFDCTLRCLCVGFFWYVVVVVLQHRGAPPDQCEGDKKKLVLETF